MRAHGATNAILLLEDNPRDATLALRKSGMTAEVVGEALQTLGLYWLALNSMPAP